MSTTRTRRVRRIALAVTAAVVLPLSVTACSSEDGGDGAADSQSASPAESMPADGAQEESGNTAATDTSKPFGPGCQAVPEDGEGSFDGMADDPVATAASNNPALSTLVSAVQKAGLVDTLNSAENITVFAPTDDAFAKIPEKDLNAVLEDEKALTEILTYHVVGERLTPEDLENGPYPTLLDKKELTVSGSEGSYTVNDASKVVCGNVPTANATVYIVDTVLMPQ
jgi:uncharacterized surface protein with fasciclin (FAS1) repeats